ncbi:hypothetical protein BLTE_05880 [Blastochloris tepida]|uniref:Uncharacterized protein n=1 Tax=Blastochloris tepida TaxID=2233851 RepID=A0A348FX70_9HYPH|nr:hypothetical protein BLTE_05880 [Blastochloris tepida]
MASAPEKISQDGRGEGDGGASSAATASTAATMQHSTAARVADSPDIPAPKVNSTLTGQKLRVTAGRGRLPN